MTALIDKLRSGLRIDITVLAYLFLYIPVVIFLITWMKWYVAIVSVFAIAAGLYFQLKDGEHAVVVASRGMVITSVALMLISLMWVLLSGIGGIAFQEYDFFKHNYMLELLVNKSWPIKEVYRGNQGLLTYYIGGYIVPCLIGKLGKSVFLAELISIIWNTAGLMIVFVLIRSFIGCRNKTDIIVIALLFMLFDTFCFPLKSIHTNLFGIVGTREGCFSDNYMLSYHGNLAQLRWVYIQALPSWTATIMILIDRGKKSRWGLIALPVIFYSILAFAGLIIFGMTVFVYDLIRDKTKTDIIKDLFGPVNLLSFFAFAPILLYFAGSVLQDKPDDASLGIKFINHIKEPSSFIFFTLTWLIWVVLLLLSKSRDKDTVIISGAMLLVTSFLSVGFYNDLGMRATITPIMVLSVLVLKEVLTGDDKYIRMILVIALIFSGFPEVFGAITRNIIVGSLSEKRARAYSSLEEFESDIGSPALYQYYNWDTDSIVRYVIKDSPGK